MAKKLIGSKDLSIFCRQMALVMQSDISIVEGVTILLEQSVNKHLREAMKLIEIEMQQGTPFSVAFNQHKNIYFPTYLCDMVTLGEQSGNLDVTFSTMSDYYDKEAKLKRKVTSAVTYPAVLTVLMLGIIIFLIVSVLPMFSDILLSMGADMPGVTKALMGFSDAIGSAKWVLLGILLALIVFLRLYVFTPRGRMFIDTFKMKTPPFKNVFLRITTARFARSMALLLKSGVNLLNALAFMGTIIGNVYVAEIIKKCEEKVTQGHDLAEALKEAGIFPPLFLRMVSIGQTTGFLDEMMSRSADIFDDEVDEALEQMTALIEPVLVIVLSLIVGVILLSVMLPMISIMNSIG